MNKGKTGRHAPAFILLILSMEPTHGLGILSKMDEFVPGHRLDTAIVYRVLKKLESENNIYSKWADSDAGPKKKVYHITEEGQETLKLFKDDIEKRIKRLQTFLELYDDL